MRKARKEAFAVAATAVVVVTSCAQPSSVGRQEEIAQRGAQVMPFDLERTTHHFKPLRDGGVQMVVADDPSDRDQVVVIRAHLRKEANAFAGGDFADPEQVHGREMPGLEVLRSRYDEIEVTLSSTPAGARIRYRSEAAEVVDALHRWFEAQLMDHGDHATQGG